MKLKRIIKTLGVSLAAMSMFAIPVFAQNMSFDFNVENDGYGNNVSWTDGNPKDDGDDYAVIHCTGNNLVDSDEFVLTLIDSDTLGNVSPEYSISSDSNWNFAMNYYGDVNEGEWYRLKAETRRNQVSYSGYWFS